MRPRPVPEAVGFDDYVAAGDGELDAALRASWWRGVRVGAWAVVLTLAGASVLLLWLVP